MKLQQANKANRQKQVVKTAARLFSSTGYRLTTVEMVAQRANVSPVTIYNNFENKTGLLLVVLIDEGVDMEEVGERIVAQRKPADLSVIYNLVDVLCTMLHEVKVITTASSHLLPTEMFSLVSHISAPPGGS